MFINPSNPAPRHQKNPPHPLEFSRSLLTPSFTDRIVHLLLRSTEPSASYSFFFAFSPQSKRIPLGKAWCDGEQILILTSSSPRAYALIFTSAFARDTFILTSCPSRIEWTTCFFLIFLIFSGTSAQTIGFFFLLHQTALTWYTPMILPLELELVRFFLTDSDLHQGLVATRSFSLCRLYTCDVLHRFVLVAHTPIDRNEVLLFDFNNFCCDNHDESYQLGYRDSGD